MSGDHKSIFYRIEWSAIVTFIGIVLLFSCSVLVTLIAPFFVETSWIQPSSTYQVQMYEVADPNFYISGTSDRSGDLQFVYHLKDGYTLLAFHESPTVKILAPKELEKYVNRENDSKMKLTSRLLLLRKPKDNPKADEMVKNLRQQWEKDNPEWKEKKMTPVNYSVWELYDPGLKEAFSQAHTDGILENWVDQNFELFEEPKQEYHKLSGVIYVNNPTEYRYSREQIDHHQNWYYNADGQAIDSLEELTSPPLSFTSRKDLIYEGEHIYAIEGCFYCHTDQTRTLVQDVVLNGSANFPAPPSSPNEYIYQRITFPGTKRNGPDLSRTGVKRASRDWHKAHFWDPTSQSAGSIMPSFKHFFDYDPRGTSQAMPGVPNRQFEAIFQYLMTKGTRITPPTQAWWLGLDPVKTIDIIEGRKVVD